MCIRDRYKDNSLEIVDDGRGMPVDIHPQEKVSGVEPVSYTHLDVYKRQAPRREGSGDQCREI